MLEVARKRLSYRAAFDRICGLISGIPGEEGIAVMARTAEVDPSFASFHSTLRHHGIPLTILSSGFRGVISRVLGTALGGSEQLEIIASNHLVSPEPEMNWSVAHVDDSEVGHDKSVPLLHLREKHGERCPILVFCGDGLNDILPSQHADLVFAKKGSTLTRQCARLGVPFFEFSKFEEVQAVLERGLEVIPQGLSREQNVEMWRQVVYGPGYLERAEAVKTQYVEKDAGKQKGGKAAKI